MKLLITTQKVDKDDAILGFFHRWIEEFARHFERVTIICLEEGRHSLPANVRILSLGKERLEAESLQLKAFIKIGYVLNFYKYVWLERKKYDSVFVHMNPEYVVLGGLLWRLLGKKVALWYVHRQVNLKLWLALLLVNVVFTSAKESFGIQSNKVQYMGHGIDVSFFKPSKHNWEGRTLISVGRITSIKNCEVLIKALHLLMKNDPEWRVVFVGDTVTEKDRVYKKELESKIKKLGLSRNVEFVGPLSPEMLRIYFSKSFASVNMAPTGGMDKVVLESLAVGIPAFVSNEAFAGVYQGDWRQVYYPYHDSKALSQRVESFLRLSLEERENMLSNVGNIVRSKYSIDSVVSKIMKAL